jgi:hypothetical protein
MENITLITAIAGLIFGIFGTALGMLNTWHAFDRDKVRIIVEPWVSTTPDEGTSIGIDVINLSLFPITIKGAGFTFIGHGKNLDLSASFNFNNKFPQRMKPFTSTTIFMGACQGDRWLKVRHAYADTAHGKRFTGMTFALRRKIRTLVLATPVHHERNEVIKKFIKTVEE